MGTVAERPSSESIRSLLAGAGDLPTLPELAARILREVRAPRVTTASLAALIGRDPLLASSVLRVANSALYGARVEITDLAFAMTRIGLDQTRNLVLANVLRSSLADREVYGPSGPALMNHALAVACGSQLLADAVHEAREEAFLCGLLHDVGRLALIKVLRELRGVDGGELPRDVAELADGLHAEAGAHLADAWGLPSIVGLVARFHHEVDAAPERGRGTVALVSLADALAHRLGLGPETGKALDLSVEPARRHLSIGDETVEEIASLLPEVFETARASMGCVSE